MYYLFCKIKINEYHFDFLAFAKSSKVYLAIFYKINNTLKTNI